MYIAWCCPPSVPHSRGQGKEGLGGGWRGDASRRQIFSRGNAEDCRGDELMNTHHMVNYEREWKRAREMVGCRGHWVWWKSVWVEGDEEKTEFQGRRWVKYVMSFSWPALFSHCLDHCVIRVWTLKSILFRYVSLHHTMNRMLLRSLSIPPYLRSWFFSMLLFHPNNYVIVSQNVKGIT